MNIVLIGNLPEDRQESMQRFTAMLQTGMEARGHTVTLLSPTLRLARYGPRYHYNGLPKYLGYFDKFVLFPRHLRQRLKAARPDVVHFTDHASAIYFSSLRDVPVLATCHDLMQIRAARGEIPQQKISRTACLHQSWIRQCLARLPRVACVSDETRQDLVRLTSLPQPRITTIPNALNYPYKPIPEAVSRRRLAALLTAARVDPALFQTARSGFVLNVGGEHWYKNRSGLLAIYAGLAHSLSPMPALVMVGPPLSAGHEAEAASLGVRERILVLSGLTNEQLEALYNLAEGLIFPSWEEGFGWPIAEAQACGCPVFTSDRAPMNKVGGRSSIYFDPLDPAGAACTIAAAWSTRKSRRALALEESKRWQPGFMLDAYESLYRQPIS